MRFGKIKINIIFIFVGIIFIFSGFTKELIGAWGSLLLHEFAHIGALKRANLDYYELEILPFGGVAKIKDLLSPEEEIIISFAGPLANIIILFVLFPLRQSGYITGPWSDYLLNINILMASLNLIPALPLDGGRILRAHLARKQGYNQATWLVLRITRYLTFLAFIGSIILFFLGLAGLLSLFLAFFVLLKAHQEEEDLILLKLGDMLRRKEQLTCKALKGEVWSAPSYLKIKELIKYINPRFFHLITVLDDNMEILGILEEKDLQEAFASGGLTKTLKEYL